MPMQMLVARYDPDGYFAETDEEEIYDVIIYSIIVQDGKGNDYRAEYLLRGNWIVPVGLFGRSIPVGVSQEELEEVMHKADREVQCQIPLRSLMIN